VEPFHASWLMHYENAFVANYGSRKKYPVRMPLIEADPWAIVMYWHHSVRIVINLWTPR
jgi:hypothetical protein